MNAADKKSLLELDLKTFVEILKSDKLPLSNENLLIDLVSDYIKLRKDVKHSPILQATSLARPLAAATQAS